MFTLIGLGVGVCLYLQRGRDCCAGCVPGIVRTMGGLVPVYFEAAAVITTLVLLGQVLELRARAATGKAIRALLGLAPKTARLVQGGGKEDDVPLARSRRSVTFFAFGPAKKCRSTVKWSRGTALSMNR